MSQFVFILTTCVIAYISHKARWLFHSVRHNLMRLEDRDQSHREQFKRQCLKIKARIENMNENEFFVRSFCPQRPSLNAVLHHVHLLYEEQWKRAKKKPAKTKRPLQFFNCAPRARWIEIEIEGLQSGEAVLQHSRTHSGHTEGMAIDAEKTRN